MLETYKRFWLLSFNNDEKDDRFQFWLPFFINIALLFLLFYAVILIEKIKNNILFFSFIIVIFPIFFYPMMSSAMRRINDVGIENTIVKWIYKINKIFIGIMCILILAKYIFKVQILNIDITHIYNVYIPLIIIYFFSYALLPSNYFKKTVSSK